VTRALGRGFQFALPDRAPAQAPAPDTTRKSRSVSERHAAKRLFFGVVTGAALGALEAYGWIHSPMAGPNDGARTYKYFVTVSAIGGGAFGVAGLWWCPGDCRS
jgi:hypothetical protein